MGPGWVDKPFIPWRGLVLYPPYTGWGAHGSSATVQTEPLPPAPYAPLPLPRGLTPVLTCAGVIEREREYTTMVDYEHSQLCVLYLAVVQLPSSRKRDP